MPKILKNRPTVLQQILGLKKETTLLNLKEVVGIIALLSICLMVVLLILDTFLNIEVNSFGSAAVAVMNGFCLFLAGVIWFMEKVCKLR